MIFGQNSPFIERLEANKFKSWLDSLGFNLRDVFLLIFQHVHLYGKRKVVLRMRSKNQPAHRNATPPGNNKMAANKQRSAQSFDWAFYASEVAFKEVSSF